MIAESQEFVQLINTAIVKTKEKRINSSYEERLSSTCQSPAVEALSVAVNHLAESQKISKDQAAVMLVETLRELDSVWTDYVMMEGLSKLKDLLKNTH
jgi:hypothetical protein